MDTINNSDRDAEICRLYEEEQLTLAAIGARYGISRERVRQIVNTYNIEKRILYPSDAIRNKFIGAFITEEDKNLLRMEALERKSSISLMTSDFVHIFLQELRALRQQESITEGDDGVNP